MAMKAGSSPSEAPTPALVPGRVRHLRRTPLRHGFDHGVYQWLVDLDDPPPIPLLLRPWARFRAADHLGDPGPASATSDPRAQLLRIKDNVAKFLAVRGVDLGRDGRVVMLANARVFGYVFDPLTVFWCHAGDRLVAVVAEVHNTYGERSAYLLRAQAPEGTGADPFGARADAVDGRLSARVPKHFYVSPFNDVVGDYDVDVRLDSEHVGVGITLRQDDDAVFTARFDGRPVAYTPRLLARYLITKPLMPQRVSALIAMHGACLWLRRLPVRVRPAHTPPEGV